jgi:hypothetical protein
MNSFARVHMHQQEHFRGMGLGFHHKPDRLRGEQHLHNTSTLHIINTARHINTTSAKHVTAPAQPPQRMRTCTLPSLCLGTRPFPIDPTFASTTFNQNIDLYVVLCNATAHPQHCGRKTVSAQRMSVECVYIPHS